MLRCRSKRSLGTIANFVRYPGAFETSAQISAAPSERDCGSEDVSMMTLCIRYTLDANKLADFETYALELQQPIARCGGERVSYYLPTKVAGPTNIALGLIDFPDLAAYLAYREKLTIDAGAVACLRQAEAARCILIEDRSFVRRVAS
jgi:NIPSNAP